MMTEQEELYAFHYEVGKAMERWAWVETELAMICGQCSSVRNHGHSHIVGFYAIENFRSRLAYTDALINVRFKEDPPLLKLWSTVRRRVDKMATLRNQLAHRRATVIKRGKPSERIALMETDWILNEPLRAELVPASEKIMIRDVAHRSAQFFALYQQLVELFRLMSNPSRPRQLPPAQTIPRPSMRQIESVMREAMGRAQRPGRS